jgi:peptidoglycan/xylan/chitin deacetylase (PgdA/CDA1 family)
MAESSSGAQDFGEPIVSLNFDDSHGCLVQTAEPIIRARGLRGTFFVSTDRVHIPPRNPENVSISDLADLVEHGHEVGSHAIHHHKLTELSETEALAEVRDSKAWFERQGIPVTSFAYPLAAINDTIKGYVQTYYAAGRTSQRERVLNPDPPDRYLLDAYRVEFLKDSAAYLRDCVDRAIAERAWLILLFHHIHPDADSRLEYSVEDFTDVCDYIVSTGVKCATIADVVSE